MMAMLSSWLHRIAADCTLLFPSRAVLLQRVPNLCVMGGDAHAIVRSHLRPCSVSHVFINFPEPPSGYQVIALQLPCNCPATALQLPSGYQVIALQLPCNCPPCNCPGTALPATALEPPCNCPATALEPPCNFPAPRAALELPTALEPPCNCPATSLQLPSGYQVELRQIATDQPLISLPTACDCPRTVCS